MSRGGFRIGSGRKPDGATPRTIRLTVPLTDAEHAELLDYAGDVPLAKYLRDAGLSLGRTRRPQ